jgi:hypothetical protein
VGIAWADDVDREAIQVDYVDPHFGDGHTRLGVMYADASDGETAALVLQRPFYSLDTRRAGGVRLFDGRLNEPRYVLGDEIGEFEHTSENPRAAVRRLAGTNGSLGAPLHRRHQL